MRYKNSLQHWGIKGMKWGVRRYQNKDGSLTPAGRKRYSDPSEETSSSKSSSSQSSSKQTKPKKEKPKPVYEIMDDAELEKTVRRLELEKRYRNAAPEKDNSVLPSGRAFVKRMVDNVVLPSIESAAKDVLTNALKSGFNEMMSSSNNSNKNNSKK